MVATTDASELREFCLSLPKTDLHAHLTGSINRQALHKIWLARKSLEPDLALEDPLIAMRDDYGHSAFFSLFTSYIYKLVDNADAVRLATEETLKDFEADGVMHFEARTTPRASKSMSKDLYIQTILSAVSRSNQSSKTMKTYLIISIDRRNTAEQAMEAVDLAIKYQDQGVVGMDLCGDSLCGDIIIFKDAFAKASAAGLYITFHFGEEPSCEPELMTLLAYGPTRLGHLLFITEEAREYVIQHKLGVELCLTSNIKGPHVASFPDHHLQDWLKEDCPIALCTDDVGVQLSPGSNEYFLAAEHFGLSYLKLWEIAMSSISATFVDESEKERYREKLLGWKRGPGSRWIK